MLRFSVIIPIYNKEKDVETTIKSVLNQTYIDYEIILVDDGSTDNSLNIVNAIEDDRIQIFTKQNEGVSKTRNYGITKSKRINIGLDLNIKNSGVSTDSTFSGISEAFRYKNSPTSRFGLTAVGLRVKLQPFKSVQNFFS